MIFEALLNRLRIPIMGFIMHVILIYVLFDTDTRSPLLKDLSVYKIKLRATPANRLVLFNGDGIRARTFFRMKNGTTPIVFLR